MQKGVQAVSLSEITEYQDVFNCPKCGADSYFLVPLGDIEPERVKGNHCFEISIFQCETCESIVIAVFDDFD